MVSSTPNIRTTYGITTRSSTPSEARLSTFTVLAYGLPSFRRARISPATGIARNAANAAYRWMPPDMDSGTPGRSVGKAPISSMHRPQIPTSAAALRSLPRRARRTAKAVAPTAKSVSEAGSSQPSRSNAYSLIRVCTGSSPVATCRPSMDTDPATIAVYPPRTIHGPENALLPMASTIASGQVMKYPK
ncbi:hypothetical protein GCM10010156_58760 [Planobispora rosea]|uniref:Uncharacterized protein n=1 Tax=Planobispora rosea TaxID=35762 RepID=A0A8J3WGV6_PLARO|nr:hypothetical protein GCM10010156_58760 [Planobispora rosea]GIH87226.1 hypothetical protein Pro02_56340 [Planobispora rosea]